jgi:hypothetical protein
MKIHDSFEQNSLEWLVARSGIPTASDFGNLVTDKFEIRKGQMPETYLMKKLAEAWIGGALPGANMLDMEFGKILEEEAIPWYEFTFSEAIRRAALVTTDDDRIGCSPDGLIGDDGGIEIKCPRPDTHIGYLLSGGLPEHYGPQVHGSMLVTGRAWWRFVSYRRNFPNLVLLIERDDAKQEVLREALDSFLDKFERAMKRLEEMAGKPRPKKLFGLPKPPDEEKPLVNIDEIIP